jgi:hypothetical protein
MVSIYVSPKWLAWCMVTQFSVKNWQIWPDLKSVLRTPKMQNKVSEEISEEINVT